MNGPIIIPHNSHEQAVRVVLDSLVVEVPLGSTILDACRTSNIDIPTLCYAQTLTPVNACRVCVVEVEGSRVLVPSCVRKVEDGMVIRTDTERVRTSRCMVLELLASSVDLSCAAPEVAQWMASYGADPDRYGVLRSAAAEWGEEGDAREPTPAGIAPQTVEQPVKRDNELYVRDYSKCILCYKCVEACGVDAQSTFAIAVAGRGFDAHVSTEYDVGLPDSACVYCGNCIAVCPTGALMFASEYDLRQEGVWDESHKTVTTTVCPYCGVGCNLELRVQDNRIVKVTSPMDHDVTLGNLCVKGRFGYEYVQNREED